MKKFKKDALRVKVDCKDGRVTEALPYITKVCTHHWGEPKIPLVDNNRYLYIDGYNFGSSSDHAKFIASSYVEISLEKLKEILK